MADIIIGAGLLVVIVLAVRYIVRARKSGKCIGCPDSGACGRDCHCKKEPR